MMGNRYADVWLRVHARRREAKKLEQAEKSEHLAITGKPAPAVSQVIKAPAGTWVSGNKAGGGDENAEA